MLLPVYDDRGDLLVHEDEDCAEEGGNDGCEGGPHGVVAQGVDQPAAAFPSRAEGLRNLNQRGQITKLEKMTLNFSHCTHTEFWRVDLNEEIGDGHREDGDDDGKVGDESADLME